MIYSGKVLLAAIFGVGNENGNVSYDQAISSLPKICFYCLPFYFYKIKGKTNSKEKTKININKCKMNIYT